jgi:hypothetical protein
MESNVDNWGVYGILDSSRFACDVLAAVCYVGSSNYPKVRAAEHWSDANRMRFAHNPKFGEWLRTLEFPPRLIIIETKLPSQREAFQAERYWTIKLKENGIQLFNLTAGQGGHFGPRGEFSAEHRKALSDAHLGVPLSDRHRQSISYALRGKVHSTEHEMARMKALSAVWHTPEHGKAISQGKLARSMPTPCPVCGKICKNVGGMKVHMSRKHGDDANK